MAIYSSDIGEYTIKKSHSSENQEETETDHDGDNELLNSALFQIYRPWLR